VPLRKYNNLPSWLMASPPCSPRPLPSISKISSLLFPMNPNSIRQSPHSLGPVDRSSTGLIGRGPLLWRQPFHGSACLQGMEKVQRHGWDSSKWPNQNACPYILRKLVAIVPPSLATTPLLELWSFFVDGHAVFRQPMDCCQIVWCGPSTARPG